MSEIGKRWSGFLERNNVLRNRLLTWELMVFQLGDDRYRSDGRFLTTLQFVQQLLERDLSYSFAIEEGGLYADADDLPDFRSLVRQLRGEHDAFRNYLDTLGTYLTGATVLDNLEFIRTTGAEFAHALRAHMRRDEQELIPLAEARCQKGSRERLGRTLFSLSGEVA